MIFNFFIKSVMILQILRANDVIVTFTEGSILLLFHFKQIIVPVT